MKLTKIQRVLKLKQSGWMKKYIDFNTGKRMNAANDFEKKIFEINNQQGISQDNGKFMKKNQCEISK